MDKPTPGAMYQGFTKDGLDETGACMMFYQKYGYQPAEVHDAGTVWLCGPVGGDVPVTDAGRLSDIVDTLIGDDGRIGDGRWQNILESSHSTRHTR